MKEVLEGILEESSDVYYELYLLNKTKSGKELKYILGHLSYYLGKKVKITIEVLDEK